MGLLLSQRRHKSDADGNCHGPQGGEGILVLSNPSPVHMPQEKAVFTMKEWSCLRANQDACEHRNQAARGKDKTGVLGHLTASCYHTDFHAIRKISC